MTMLAPKRPTEVKRYVLDYSRELGDDAIEAYQLVVTSGQVSVFSSEQSGSYSITAFIAGGVDAQTSTLELQITTNSGQLLIRDLSILTSNVSNATGALPSSTTKGQIMEMVLAQLGLAGIGWTATEVSTTTKGQLMQMALAQLGFAGAGYSTALASTTTKGQIVNMAFEEIGLAGYEFDATTAEQAGALQRLDSLMAQWSGPGVNLQVGYGFPAQVGGSAMTDKSGIPDILLDAVVCGLALSLAPAIGKTLGAEAQKRIDNGILTTRVAYAANLRELDALMAKWSGPGMNLNLGYNFPKVLGGSQGSDASGIPDIAVEAVTCALALALAPAVGKTLPPETQVRVKDGIMSVRTAYAVDLRELDALMAQWASPGVNLDIGYNFPVSFGGSQISDLSGIPDLAIDAVVLSLSHAMPIPGKALAPDFYGRLARAMSALRATFAKIPTVRLPRETPRGAGAKPWSTWWPFVGSFDAGSAAPNQTQASPVLETESGILIGTENGEIIGV